MSIKYKRAQNKVKKYNQEHLLQFYDELDENQKEILLNQILDTDFEGLKNLYDKSFEDDSIDSRRISSIKYIRSTKLSEEEKTRYKSIGEDIISKGKLAVVTLAGGQGTRLGFKGPKGCYELDTRPKKSLFEFICDKLKKVHKDYGVYLNWYIMTSVYNDKKTKEYFIFKDYFGYPKENIHFFKQDTLPVVDVEGKIILDKIYELKEASNGNGDVFRAFGEAGLTKTITNLEWFSISGVDNILLDIIDPLFLGISANNKSDVASKSIPKKDLTDKTWVFANVDNKTNIIDPKNLSKEMLISKNEDGAYNYNQMNILSHLFTKDAFVKSIKLTFPYSRAYKKNDYINDEGVKTVPTSPNSFKFEKFIFDAFKHFDNFTLLEVKEEDEFAPIKAFTGEFTPEIAVEKYKKKFNK